MRHYPTLLAPLSRNNVSLPRVLMGAIANASTPRVYEW